MLCEAWLLESGAHATMISTQGLLSVVEVHRRRLLGGNGEDVDPCRGCASG
jgi:hypothetical protein